MLMLVSAIRAEMKQGWLCVIEVHPRRARRETYIGGHLFLGASDVCCAHVGAAVSTQGRQRLHGAGCNNALFLLLISAGKSLLCGEGNETTSPSNGELLLCTVSVPRVVSQSGRQLSADRAVLCAVGDATLTRPTP